MTKAIIISIYFLLAVAASYSCFKERRTDSQTAIYVRIISALASAGCILEGLFLTANSYGFALVIKELYCLGTTWFLYFFLKFSERFAKSYPMEKAISFAITVCCIFDSLLFIINTFTFCLFKITPFEFMKMQTYTSCDYTILFSLHAILCLTLSIFIILSLYSKAKHEKNPTRRKTYAPVLSLFVFLVVINFLAAATKIPVDVTNLAYCILVNLVAYYSTEFVDDRLKDSSLALIMDEIKDFIIVCDNNANISYINPITTQSVEEKEIKRFINESFDTLKSLGDDTPDDFAWNVYIVVNGSLKTFNCHYQKIKTKEEITGHLFTMSDRSQEIENYKREKHQRTHDPLTGLYRKEYFYECAKNKLTQNPNINFYLIYSDIYGFKMYNSLYGSRMGDKVLIAEAEYLRALKSKYTVYGRLDSDEFALLISEDDFDEQGLINRIHAMRENFGNDQYRIYINAGVYKITDRNETISSMCDKAKMALDRIRDDYNILISYYDDELIEKSYKERLYIEQLDEALRTNQFKMFLQPQVDSATEKWVGAEALVRWIHPDGGIISPGEFIPIFEKFGCIPKVDMFMWEEAAKQLRRWKDAGLNDLYISVNISGADFFHFEPCEVLLGLVKKYNIDPSKLKLEITETVLMKSTRSHKDIISEFKENGFSVEIDDFGSGYSSLNTLRDIDVDVIKLDMGFLKNPSNKDRNDIILENVVKMIKELNIETIAEGVELKEQAEELTKLGCDKFQGYYYSKPIPISDFDSQLEAHM